MYFKFPLTGRPATLQVAAWIVGLAIIAVIPASLVAQTDLPVDQRANLVAEINLERFHSSPIGKTFDAGDLLGSGAELGEFRELDWSKIKSVRISALLPKDVSSVMGAGMTGGDLPLQFSILLRASDPAALAQVAAMIQGDSEFDEVEGMKLFRMPGGPGNLAAVFPNELTMAIGTDEYLKRLEKNVASDGVLDSWKGLPDGLVRIAGDLKQCEDLFDELQQMGGMAPPPMDSVLEALPQIASLTVRQDFEGEQLLVVRAVGRSAASTGPIRAVLDSLAGLIREGAAESANAPPEMKPMADMANEIAAGTKVSEESGSVVLSIDTPKDFAKRLEADVIPMTQTAAKSAQKMNDMKQICLAMHNYYDAYRRFPQSPNPNVKGKLSWRVQVLPFLEEMAVFDRVDVNQDWDSEANNFLVDKMPSVFGDDGRGSMIAAVRLDKQPASFQEITDGTSNTIAFIRLNESVPWASDRDVTIDQVVKMFGSMNGQGSVLIGLYDGSVRQLPANTAPDKLRAMLTPAGGEVVDF